MAYDGDEDDGSDPVASVAHASDELLLAVSCARRIGEMLDEAHSAVASQGHHGRAREF